MSDQIEQSENISMKTKLIVYSGIALFVAACFLVSYHIFGKIYDILDKPIYEAAENKQSLLDADYFHISSVENYPRKSDVEKTCGSVDYIITDKIFNTVNDPSLETEFNLFCKDNSLSI